MSQPSGNAKFTTARNPQKIRSWLEETHADISSKHARDSYIRAAASHRTSHHLLKLAHNLGVPGATRADVERTDVGREIVFRTTAKSAKKKLTKLAKNLVGEARPVPFPTSGMLRIRVVFPEAGTLAVYRRHILHLRRETNVLVHARAALGDIVVPVHLAGWCVGSGMYVVVTTDPGESRPVKQEDADRALYMLKNMVVSGLYPETASVLQKRPNGAFLVHDPSLLLEIPKGIHTAFVRYVIGGDNVGDAWVAAGGATWAAAHETRFAFEHHFRPTEMRQITSSATLKNHLALAIRNPLRGRVGTPDDVRDAITMLQRLVASGTKLGRGAHGDVYEIRLDDVNQSRLYAIKRSLTNTMEFGAYDGRSAVVLKVERLRGSTLALDTVYRLAGEAYLQQYVHENRGLATRTIGRKPVAITPRVYFSGTLGNAFHLICMDRADGIPLKAILKKQRVVSDAVYGAMKRAIETMLRNGVVHSDLHFDNVLVSGSGRTLRVHILDFGFASILTPAMKKKIVGILDNGGSVHDAFFQTGLIDSINAIKQTYPYYHSNATTLADLKRRRNQGAKRGLRSHPIDTSPRTVLRSSTSGGKARRSRKIT